MSYRLSRGFMVLVVLALMAACIPARVKELNAMGQKAIADRRYDLAVNYLAESLSIYPDQPQVALRLGSAKVMLKQIYVTKIYDLVDGPTQPVGTYLSAWKMSADLQRVDVAKARVVTIRIDLDSKFSKEEKRLRSQTEPHDYYLHLTKMNTLVPSRPVAGARGAVSLALKQTHLAARGEADKARMSGLALLHAAAAATFAPGDTGLWVDVSRRRAALIQKLGIPISLEVQSKAGAGNGQYLLGGLKRRTPRIFLVRGGAPLRLTLEARRPESDQRVVNSRHSAPCKVGTRRENNPECPSLLRRSEMAKRTYEQKLSALEVAKARCATEQQASGCTSHLSSASRDVDSSRRSYEELERKVGKCPPFVARPIFKTFFYNRSTISRRVTTSGTVKLVRDGKVWRSRGVVGGAAAQDTYGEGLGCARIPADPLNLESLAQLRIKADELLLDRCFVELNQMRRDLAKKQMAGGSDRDRRMDSLVRARLVDETFGQATRQLSHSLASVWTSDFDLPQRILK